ncbi:hypothetical protein [Jannaschia sp. W003]|uniref:hypothetical protein n=1 Tax=Jannaschia sp. W003 TaxID=2867012 RepID=UPI0021A806E1|nr:hypothetical protein [Jannaschia sp. W003]UWQ21582.1 hypothetical protein K3554_00675 [Jannaschia sp. W003]
MLGTLLGGSPWLWLGLAWVAAVPLTLVWVRVMEMWSRADLRAPQVTHRSIARRTDDR